MFFDYKSKLSNSRCRLSTVSRNRYIDDFYSDRSRILYCSSFRRLQQKAQVFSLESNSSIRTRLTHSLEVSDLGRTLASQIAYKLNAKKYLSMLIDHVSGMTDEFALETYQMLEGINLLRT